MKAQGLSTTVALLALLLSPACVVETPAGARPAPNNSDQIAGLQRLAGSERKIRIFAELLHDVAGAEVKVRSQRAIILLTPKPGAKVGRRSVEAVNKYTKEQTGLDRKQIVIKMRAPREVTQ